uniref:50S ribosomal protein L31 n=1 Tax=Brassica campestris TaxID=3711 RepID=M4CKE8_BRACM
MVVSLPNSFLLINPCAHSLVIKKPVKAASISANRGSKPAVVQVTCRKKDMHPEFHEDAKVYCNGELVMTTGGTKKEYVVDVWSGNHPFYLGNQSALMVDADQVEKFRKRFAGLSEIMEIPVLKGEIVLPTKKSKGAGKGKKK